MSRDNPEVSVVIPNWNGCHHLRGCLDALQAQTFRDFEILVVDNASTDGSADWILRNQPTARLVERESNGGFAVAVNEGIRSSRGRYIFLLNNDTVVQPRCLEMLVGALERSTYDFAAALMVFDDDPTQVNSAGDIFSISRLIGVQRGALKPTRDYQSPVRVLGASGGAVMYKRAFLDAVGLYDEGFFLLHEDTDINLRALVAGMKCIFVPQAVVRHKVGSSIARQPSAQMSRVATINQFQVLGKDLPGILLPVMYVFWGWHLFRNTVPLRPSKWYLLPTRIGESRERLAIQAEGYRLGRAKRAEVWRRKRVSTLSIVWWLLVGTGLSADRSIPA